MSASYRTITQFKSKLAGGGARPNLFEVQIPSFPTAALKSAAGGPGAWGSGSSQEAELFTFMCKAAALPASNIAPIEIPFRGRTLKVAGDRTFDTWTVTVINDESFNLRNAFEKWMQNISKNSNNTGATKPDSYMTDAYVYQLGRGGDAKESDTSNSAKAADGISKANILKAYKFFDIFPTNVSQIDLSYDSSDTIEEFTVEFQVQYWDQADATKST